MGRLVIQILLLFLVSPVKLEPNKEMKRDRKSGGFKRAAYFA